MIFLTESIKSLVCSLQILEPHIGFRLRRARLLQTNDLQEWRAETIPTPHQEGQSARFITSIDEVTDMIHGGHDRVSMETRVILVSGTIPVFRPALHFRQQSFYHEGELTCTVPYRRRIVRLNPLWFGWSPTWRCWARRCNNSTETRCKCVAQTQKSSTGCWHFWYRGLWWYIAYSGTCSGATVRYCSAPFDLCVGHRSSAMM